MQKIHVEAAKETAKTIGLITLISVVVCVVFMFVPMSYVMAGLGIVSLVIATKMMYEHYVWKIEREKELNQKIDI